MILRVGQNSTREDCIDCTELQRELLPSSRHRPDELCILKVACIGKYGEFCSNSVDHSDLNARP